MTDCGRVIELLQVKVTEGPAGVQYVSVMDAARVTRSRMQRLAMGLWWCIGCVGGRKRVSEVGRAMGFTCTTRRPFLPPSLPSPFTPSLTL
ncbi:hypothetical protein E2C01_003719 [Portunus trituberculatus]|uniref:Uncharacterized protein n=1 Tax=Portunus trituberculatus TaxID=210409 RepID=A0A5B7CRZ4_PORTR|nr:hypothetical protein [Portunus trituberculatus]